MEEDELERQVAAQAAEEASREVAERAPGSLELQAMDDVEDVVEAEVAPGSTAPQAMEEVAGRAQKRCRKRRKGRLARRRNLTVVAHDRRSRK